MALKSVLTADEYAALEGALQAHYAQHDGQYVLEADIDEHPAVRGLKTAYQKEQEKRKAQGQKLKAYEDLHHEPDDLAKLIEVAEAAATGKGRQELDTWKAQTVKAHETEMRKAAERIAKRDSVLQRIFAENVVRKELEPVALSTGLLLPIALQHVRMEFDEESGEARTVVVDEKGQPRVADGTGRGMTVKELVAEMASKPEYKLAFKGTEARGSGAGGAAGVKAERVIAHGDQRAFLENLEGIAAGKVAVQ